MLHGSLDGVIRVARQSDSPRQGSVLRVPEVGVQGLDGLLQGVHVDFGFRGSSAGSPSSRRESLAGLGFSPMRSSVEVQGSAERGDQLRNVAARLRLATADAAVNGCLGHLRLIVFMNAESLVWMRHGFLTGSPCRSRSP